MKIENLISKLQDVQHDYPNADIRFVTISGLRWFETFLVNFGSDKENNVVEMIFDTEK